MSGLVNLVKPIVVALSLATLVSCSGSSGDLSYSNTPILPNQPDTPGAVLDVPDVSPELTDSSSFPVQTIYVPADSSYSVINGGIAVQNPRPYN